MQIYDLVMNATVLVLTVLHGLNTVVICLVEGTVQPSVIILRN
jgi:hypothetical protein